MKHNFRDQNIKIHEWPFDDSDTRAWEEMRFNLLNNQTQQKFGASEVSAVCGSNNYESAFSLFQIKLGRTQPKLPNLLMIHGNAVESTIMEYSNAYDPEDPSVETTAANYLNKDFKRNITKARFFIESDVLPNVVVSLDGVLKKGDVEFDGSIAEFDIPVEYKNVSFSSFNSWQADISPWYYIQVQTQIASTGASHGWFVCFVDNRDLHIVKVERDETCINFIREETDELSLRITKGKLILKEIETTADEGDEEQLYTMLYDLEPTAGPEKNTTDLLKVVYDSDRIPTDDSDDEPIQGDEEDYQLAEDYLARNAEIKELTKEKDTCKNRLLQSMKGSKVMEVNGLKIKNGYRFGVTKIKGG